MSDIDKPTDVREEIDDEALGAWMAGNVDGFAGPAEVKQFPSGHSNLTYFVGDADGDEYVVRRPPHGVHVESGHDMSREWNVLQALDGHYDKIPSPLAYCDDESVIGAPFYVMERVEGVILRGSSPDVDGLDASTMEALSETFVREFGEIHDLDWRAIGLEDFGKPDGYVERQVEGWIDRYHQSQTDEIGGMARAADWLREHMPEQKDASLIHNDFKYDNMVLNPDDLTEVVAVLDWEMATVGDPLMDLGTSLAYWFEPGDPEIVKQLDLTATVLEGNYTRREVVDRYEEVTGRDCSDILFYYVYGLYKVAVIGQQIYYRYEQGHTDDPRFGMLIHAVKALAKVADSAIERESLSG